MTTPKIAWQGRIASVQPRIRLQRAFDQRSHSYLGYMLLIDGVMDNEACDFTVGISKAVQAKHGFRVGDEVSGLCLPAAAPEIEPAEFYKVSRLKLLSRGPTPDEPPPPWQGVAPALDVYRARGHRRLSARTYETKCLSCIWGCRMAVEIILDQWNPSQRRYRSETFCYGPKSCSIYRPGPQRTVPGRKGMLWVEEDWVDDNTTAHRGPDE
jgi:hypothetical protein